MIAFVSACWIKRTFVDIQKYVWTKAGGTSITT